MYPDTPCRYGEHGYHEMQILGTPRSAMTFWICRRCDGRWERGPGAFHGMTHNDPPTLEERVAKIEKRILGDQDRQ